MDIEVQKDKIVVKVNNFDAIQTFECGQCFRWKEQDGVYTGVAFVRVINVCPIEGGFELYSCSENEYDNI